MTSLSVISGSYFTRLCLKNFVEYTLLHVHITKNHFKKSFQIMMGNYFISKVFQRSFKIIKSSETVILAL